MQSPVVNAARAHLGTRFHHQGRLAKTGKHKGGLDCLGLLVTVASDLNLVGKNGEAFSSFDVRDYSHRPDTAALRRILGLLLDEVQDMHEGDVALFNIDGAPQHMGIISEYENGWGIIHAYAPARAVVEHALDAYWRSKLVGLFRLSKSSDLIRGSIF